MDKKINFKQNKNERIKYLIKKSDTQMNVEILKYKSTKKQVNFINITLHVIAALLFDLHIKLT